MSFLAYMVLAASCLVVGSHNQSCVIPDQVEGEVAGAVVARPVFTGQARDVILTAEAALAWDWETGEILYEKEPDTRRPVASLSKLLTILAVRQMVAPTADVLVTQEAKAAQRLGANVRLPQGDVVKADELYKAALVASANDAAVALAVAAGGSEESFVELANGQAALLGLHNTRIANATGLTGGEQYSTARDVRQLLTRVYSDNYLRPYLSTRSGTIVTNSGFSRSYTSTNKLLGTYVPILAGKTGYTVDAGQNLAILTTGNSGQTIGVVVLGSEERFQDTKVLVEWLKRNYTWDND